MNVLHRLAALIVIIDFFLIAVHSSIHSPVNSYPYSAYSGYELGNGGRGCGCSGFVFGFYKLKWTRGILFPIHPFSCGHIISLSKIFPDDINILRLLVTCYVSSQLCVSKFIAFAITILYEQIWFPKSMRETLGIWNSETLIRIQSHNLLLESKFDSKTIDLVKFQEGESSLRSLSET